MFNKKGQAFSTFQLLIAAVVALALLGVLLPMISGGFNFGNSPSDATQQLASSQINNVSALGYTEAITFKNGDSISVGAIANDLSIGRQQVYIFAKENDIKNGMFSDPDDVDNFQITYEKNEKTSYKIGIICDYATTIEETLKSYKLDDFLDADEIDDDVEDADLKVCFIFPERASE